jgi:ABC-type phosphate transport system permease subunit
MGTDATTWKDPARSGPAAEADAESRGFKSLVGAGASFIPITLVMLVVWALVSVTQAGSVGWLGSALLRSTAVAAVAMLLAVPLGLGAALYVVVFARGALARVASSVLDLLAVVPSIVWGVFACYAVGPLHAFGGVALWNAGFMLGLVVAPTFASSVRDWLVHAPRELEESAVALGGSRWASFRLILLPLIRRGLIGSIGTAFGRALGEAIAVALVYLSLGAPQSTLGTFLSTSHDLTGTSAVAALLFLVSLVVQASARTWARRPAPPARSSDAGRFASAAEAFSVTSMLVAVVSFVVLVVWLLANASLTRGDSLGPLGASLSLTFGALLFGGPIGFAAAVYAVEFERERSARILRIAAELLASTPPIVVGVFVAVIARQFGGSERAAATVALSILLAPSVMRRSARAFLRVSAATREAAVALGASRARTFTHVVFRGSKRYLLGAFLGAAARTLGSTAPLVLLFDLDALPSAAFRAALRGDPGLAARHALLLLGATGLLKVASLVAHPAEAT